MNNVYWMQIQIRCVTVKIALFGIQSRLLVKNHQFQIAERITIAIMQIHVEPMFLVF